MPYCNYVLNSGQYNHESTNPDELIMYRIPPTSPSTSLSTSSMGGETENEDIVSHGDFLDEFFDENALYDVLLSTDFL